MSGLTSRFGFRSKVLALAASTALVAGTPALAQLRSASPTTAAPVPAPVARPAPAPTPGAQQGPVAGTPGVAPSGAVAQPLPEPPPLPPAIWDPVSAQDLVYYIQQIGREGLEPADYDPAGLEAAIRSGNPMVMSQEATSRFNRVSNDLALGHVHRSARMQWFVVDKDLDAAKQDALLRSALARHNIRGALDGLLPTHPQYAALKEALTLTGAKEMAKLNRIKLNMDRWRWLPRDLGEKYIIVNVPGFHATLVENGVNRWKHRAIAGATKTPTPQLSAMAVGVMLNPWWEVPPSISHEVAGKKGYVKSSDGKRWRQPPGPTNALGQVKFVMYNPQNIYLHDTNARSRFSGRMRALSHGCIRTEHIMDLATELLGDDGGEWTPDKIQAQLATGKSKQANFVKPVPVYIVYFSAAALLDGKIVDYQDLYGRDGKALAALQTKDGGASLFKPKPKTEVAGKPAPKVASN
jgi:murein L,D-transpeptidase YcbB/YkuD